MEKRIEKIFNECQTLSEKLSSDKKISKAIAKISDNIIKRIKKGGKVIVFGDGGSAADSQHLAAELIGRFKRNRLPIPAIALTTNTSTLTAIGNDYGFEETFVRQLVALAKKEDIAIGISTSGNSKNVLKAIQQANKLRLLTIGLTGKRGGRLKAITKHCICVPSSDTPRIQELYIKIIHVMAELIEEAFCR